MKFAVAAALVAALASLPSGAIGDGAASDDGPPPGITGVTLRLTDVLAANARAKGSAPSGRVQTRTESWTLVRGALSGSVDRIEAGDAYRSDTVLGPFREAEGRYAGKQWDQNANGYIVVETNLHPRDEIDRRALHDAASRAAGVTLLGRVEKPDAYVVKVDPPGGRIEYRYYDTRSFLLVREERIVGRLRVVTTFDDFRSTDGETEAWHVHTSDGRPFNDADLTLRNLTFGLPIPDANLQIPAAAKSPLTLDQSQVSLPAKIVNDRIYVVATMNGRKVRFQLDSGASDILLDHSVADALGYPAFGKVTASTAGTYVAARSVIPRIALGGAALANVAVVTAPFNQWGDDSNPVAGLLGFDFLAGCVVHVDYMQGTVEAIAPQAFTPSPQAIVLPVRLDDQVPIVEVHIGNATGAFVLDTGADRSMLFSDFVTAHPSEVADQGLGTAITDSFPFVDEMSGVGGEIETRPTQVTNLRIGSISLPRWLFLVSQNARSFEGEDIDGLIGQDFLRNFDLYLDYPHQAIYLIPNDRYRLRWD